MAILFEFTDAGDFGSIGDFKVRVTGGTEGTPADAGDFVTTDRAGSAVLSSPWAIGFNPILLLTVTTSTELNYRNVINADTAPSGDKIRISITASTGGALVIDGTSIGVMTTADDFDAPPTRITWVDEGGGNGITIPAGETYVSDGIVFAFDGTKRHGIHVYMASWANMKYAITGGHGQYQEVGGDDDTLTQAISYAWTANRTMVIDSLGINVGMSESLDYQIRPVEKLALLISFVVANKTTEADYIFITGTDAWGDAQTESIDVSAGNDTYITTKLFRTITDIDYSDNAGGGGVAWADGEVTVTQPQWGVIWDYGNGQYEIDSNFEVGDYFTSTYFSNIEENVTLNGYLLVRANAVHTIGDLYGDWGTYGSSWIFNSAADYAGVMDIMDGGDLNIYGSIIRNSMSGNTRLRFNSGDVIIKNSILSGKFYTGINHDRNQVSFEAGLSSLVIERVFATNLYGVYFKYKPDTITDFHVHRCDYGILNNTAGVEASNIFLTSIRLESIYLFGSGATIDMINPVTGLVSILHLYANNITTEQYPCNIHIADKDGVDLASVSVDCEYANLVEGSDNKTYKCIQDHTAVDADHLPTTGTDWADYWVLYSDTENFIKPSWYTGFAYKRGATEFSTQTTDANGDITEQNVQYKKWVGTTEYEEQRLHKFTITYAGLETLVMESITVDAPISWHLELQPMRARNYARSRLQGVQFQ